MYCGCQSTTHIVHNLHISARFKEKHHNVSLTEVGGTNKRCKAKLHIISKEEICKKGAKKLGNIRQAYLQKCIRV